MWGEVTVIRHHAAAFLWHEEYYRRDCEIQGDGSFCFLIIKVDYFGTSVAVSSDIAPLVPRMEDDGLTNAEENAKKVLRGLIECKHAFDNYYSIWQIYGL